MADQINDEFIRQAITERLQATHVEVTDMSGMRLNIPLLDSFTRSPRPCSQNITGGCGSAFTTVIVSPQFQGLNSLKRHRLVNAALKEEIAVIHAWTAKCKTPEEWERDGGERPPLDGTVGGQVEGTTQ